MGKVKSNQPTNNNSELSQDSQNVIIEVDEALKSAKEAIVIGLKSKHLKEGKEYNVSGTTAYNLIKKGVAKLK